MCPGVRTTCQSASPRRRICPSWRGSSTVYGATGWSRYSAWQQPGSRRARAWASGVLAAIPAPVACSRALPPTWSACQWVFTTSATWAVCARTHAAVSCAWPTNRVSTRAGWRPCSRSRLASGKGLRCQVTQDGSRSLSRFMDLLRGRRTDGPGSSGPAPLWFNAAPCPPLWRPDDSPRRRRAFELLPVVSVRVPGLVAGHAVGEARCRAGRPARRCRAGRRLGRPAW